MKPGSSGIWMIRLGLSLWLAGFAGSLTAQPDSPESRLVCESCHGPQGLSVNPMVPILAGQPYTLIEDNLLAFRAQRRVCAPSRNDQSAAALLAQSMCQIVAGLTDGEIAALASYFERQTFIPAKQTTESNLITHGSELHHQKGCEGCHSGGGTQTNAMAPVLAGQWTPYLRGALSALIAGDRKGPKVMNAAIQSLNANEVEALLQFYAAQPQSRENSTNP